MTKKAPEGICGNTLEENLERVFYRNCWWKFGGIFGRSPVEINGKSPARNIESISWEIAVVVWVEISVGIPKVILGKNAGGIHRTFLDEDRERIPERNHKGVSS